MPHYDVVSLTELGQGLDNVVYLVNDELVVRISKESDAVQRAETTRREAGLLAALTGWSTLPIPQPIFADIEQGALAYTALPGRPLNQRPVAEPIRLAPVLGGFLSRLHQAPLDAVNTLVSPDPYPMTAWRDDAEFAYREVSQHITPPVRRPIERFLASTPPPEPRTVTLCHNDLGTEHILAGTDTDEITGIIDWTDAALADPMRDLALIFRDLGPDVFDATIANYAEPPDAGDRARAVFYARCSVLEDIAYGVTSGAQHYADAGIAHLAWIFSAHS
nr:aminoglycoside phosphotransferase family protein [Phytoactinopolyspora alkaliphila]